MTTGIAYPVLELAQEIAMIPGSPNLLPALQTLPRPIADHLSDSKQNHKIIERSFQFLDAPEKSNRTDAQWRDVFLDGVKQIDNANSWNLESKYPNPDEELAATRQQRLALLFAKLYPVAKLQLIEAGWDESELNSMPVGKVVAIQTRRAWDAYTELFNGVENLPASKIYDRAVKIADSDLVNSDFHGCFPFPLITHTQENLLRCRWQLVEINMNLQLIRDHLAKTGSFPTAVQFKEMAFADPETGLSFQYRRLENGDAQFQSIPVIYDGSNRGRDYVVVRYTIKKADQK